VGQVAYELDKGNGGDQAIPYEDSFLDYQTFYRQGIYLCDYKDTSLE